MTAGPSSGSAIARSGFRNEDDIVNHFTNWAHSIVARKWLYDLNIKPENLESIIARRIYGEKTDVMLIVKIAGYTKPYNLQVKLVTINKGFNQVDKRWIKDYHALWGFPENVLNSLKKFTGEIKPVGACRDSKRRRFFLDELKKGDQDHLISFFRDHKVKVLEDVVRGRGPLAASFVLVVDKSTDSVISKIITINQALKIVSEGPVEISPRGSLKIGKIFMQRKGGDSGKPTANMLQFKEDPKNFLV